jgi:hypothetical protein
MRSPSAFFTLARHFDPFHVLGQENINVLVHPQNVLDRHAKCPRMTRKMSLLDALYIKRKETNLFCLASDFEEPALTWLLGLASNDFLDRNPLLQT